MHSHNLRVSCRRHSPCLGSTSSPQRNALQSGLQREAHGTSQPQPTTARAELKGTVTLRVSSHETMDLFVTMVCNH